MIGEIIQSILDAEKNADHIKRNGETRARKIGTDAQLKIESLREQSSNALTEEFKTSESIQNQGAPTPASFFPKVPQKRIDMAVQFVMDCLTDGAK